MIVRELLVQLIQKCQRIRNTVDNRTELNAVESDRRVELHELSTLSTVVHSHATSFSLSCRTPVTTEAVIKFGKELLVDLVMIESLVNIHLTRVYGELLGTEMQRHAMGIVDGMERLVMDCAPDRCLDDLQGRFGQGRLVSTGYVWNACERMKRLMDGGLSRLLTLKIKSYRDTLQDALHELQEWVEHGTTALDDLEDAFGQDDLDEGVSQPKEENTEERDTAVSQLLVRRIKSLRELLAFITLRSVPTNETEMSVVSRIDQVADKSYRITELVDECVMAVTMTPDNANPTHVEDLDDCAKALATQLIQNWSNTRDEHSETAERWLEQYSEMSK